MKKLLTLGCLLFLPSLAFASTTPGAYVQGEVGVSGAQGIFFIGPVGRLSGGYLWDAGNNAVSYGLESGISYNKNRFIDNIFGETPGYTSLNLDLLGVLKYSFDSGFNVFAKAGGAYTHITTFVDDALGTEVDSDTSTNTLLPEVAVGFGYQFNQNLEADVTASTLFFNAGTGQKGQIGTFNNDVTVGLTYHFA